MSNFRADKSEINTPAGNLELRTKVKSKPLVSMAVPRPQDVSWSKPRTQNPWAYIDSHNIRSV